MSGSDYLNSADDEYDLSYDPPPPPKRSGSLRMFMGIAAVLVVLAGAGVIGAVVLRGNAETTNSADAVRLEPTSFAGDNPFVSPVGKDQQVAAVGAGGEFSGSTAALYARDPAIPSCDGQKLVAALQADGNRAAAWAAAEKIRPGDIPAFVSGLTPVVLRADTSVTAFGYDDPSFFSYPAVLQAGTAVFISGRGEPTVKCYNGNPLASRAQPAPTVARTVSYVGPRWTTFRTTSVTVVRPSTTINKVFCFGGTGVGGTGGAGGNGAGAGAGGNGGNGTGGVGCQIGSGGTQVVDCNKTPKPAGCTPPPPPPNPGGANCTKNPQAAECQVTPGQETCEKDPKTPGCPTTPPAECMKDPKAANCPATPGTPGAPTVPAECAKDPKAANCPVAPGAPTVPAECAKDPKAANCPATPGAPTVPAECAKDPKAANCPATPGAPTVPAECAKDPKAAICTVPAGGPVVTVPAGCTLDPKDQKTVVCPAAGTVPAPTGGTPGTQVDPAQNGDPVQKTEPGQKTEPEQKTAPEQKSEPAQNTDPVQQVDTDQQTDQAATGGKNKGDD